MAEDDRSDPEVANGLLLSKIAAWAMAGALAIGAGIVWGNAYDPSRVVFIGLGYAVAVWGGNFMVGWGALRNYARLMDRERRHYEECRRLIDENADREQQHHNEAIAALAAIRDMVAENKMLLDDTSVRDGVLRCLERIESVQRQEIRTLGDVLGDDLRNHRNNTG